jgi:hypothetical protein
VPVRNVYVIDLTDAQRDGPNRAPRVIQPAILGTLPDRTSDHGQRRR